jgi:hypothetical protein
MVLTQVTINGTDVTDYVINYISDRTWGEAIAQAEIKVKKIIDEVLTLDTGQAVLIQRGWTLPTDENIFQGYIESYNPEGGTIKIVCKDKAWDLIRKEVTHTYTSDDITAGKISDIFLDLVTTYGGLTADGTTVQDSGTVITLTKFVCNHVDIFERCQKLAGVLDWQFYYNPHTDKIYFEPKGFTSNSTILTVGDNVINVPKWQYDNTEMCNDLTVVGAYQEIETTEMGQIGITAGYTTTSVQLSFTPISVKVYNDMANPPTTLKTGGLPDSTGTYDYYVDKTQKQILPKPTTTFINNSFMEVRYSHAVPIPVHMYSQTSIDAYGYFTKTITFTDLRSVADAESRGQTYLIQHSQPYIYSTLNVKSDSTFGLKVGNMVQVVDSVSTPTVNKQMVINRQVIRYPADYEENYVGDQYWRLSAWQASVEQRLKQLQEEEMQNQDLITEVITADDTLNYPINLNLRYNKTLTQNTVAGKAIWGLSMWAGGDVWCTDAFTAEADYFVIQYQNIYVETFIDTDFKGY